MGENWDKETIYGAYLQAKLKPFSMGKQNLLFTLRKEFGTLEYAWHKLDENFLHIIGIKKYDIWKEIRAGNPEKFAECLDQKGIFYRSYYETGFPKKLHQIADPPYGLYFMGELPKDSSKSVAVIGARACSGYGKEVARKVARELAEGGVEVISGMARGIDSICQQAVLDYGGSTFAVLGSGVDVCYPRELETLYQGMIQKGGILSSYPPNTAPLARNFPPRNRLISGLADVVLVIEAREQSGTLITVDYALEQGKEVFVIPGRITDDLSGGCNKLIAQGARIVCSIDEFIKELDLVKKTPSEYLELERFMSQIRGGEYVTIDEIFVKYRLQGGDKTILELVQYLTILELEGKCFSHGNGYTFIQ